MLTRSRFRVAFGLIVLAVISFVMVGNKYNHNNSSHSLDLRLSTHEEISRRPSSEVKSCDEECLRFKKHIDSWTSDKPRAAIIMLLQLKRLAKFTRSMMLFHNNSNCHYRYPIILFHEADIDSELERDRVRASVPDPGLLYFQRVTFEFPPFINQSAVPSLDLCSKLPIGYRHMCRFHVKTIYEEPILAGLLYVWRLDDDSYIPRPIGYDVIRFMADHHIRYGYTVITNELASCIEGLWPAADHYMKEHGLRQKFQLDRINVYYNNFEVSDLELWRSYEYKRFVNFIDRLGGIYYTRWGDHFIKTIAITMILTLNETHHFKDFPYEHQQMFNSP